MGKWWHPYPSWSFIWNCLKGTRGSRRSWGTGKDPRSSDAGVSDGCCGHICNEVKQNSLVFLLATGRFTQIRLQHVHGSCTCTKGKQTFHIWLSNRPHAHGSLSSSRGKGTTLWAEQGCATQTKITSSKGSLSKPWQASWESRKHISADFNLMLRTKDITKVWRKDHSQKQVACHGMWVAGRRFPWTAKPLCGRAELGGETAPWRRWRSLRRGLHLQCSRSCCPAQQGRRSEMWQRWRSSHRPPSNWWHLGKRS